MRRIMFAVLATLAFAPPAEAFQREETALAVTIKGEAHRLETLIVKPDGNGPFPLLVISHGSPRLPGDRKNMAPGRLSPQAEEFARHGYLAAVVMRRNYGLSTGDWGESYDGCTMGAYEQGGNGTADDIEAAVGVLSTRPDVDAKTVVAVGQSAGGFGSLAYAARRPQNLKAVINFAGGRGSQGKWNVCQEDRLLDAFETYGKTAAVPMLWVYAENDYFFGPNLAQNFLKRFTKNGADVTFFKAPAFGSDGHSLFGRAGGMPIWRPHVQAFLKAKGLPVAMEIADAPAPAPSAPLPPPPMLGSNGKDHWKRYLDEPDHKAFAASTEGRFGWKSGMRDEDAARKGALGNCRGDCRVLNVDGKPVD